MLNELTQTVNAMQDSTNKTCLSILSKHGIVNRIPCECEGCPIFDQCCLVMQSEPEKVTEN